MFVKESKILFIYKLLGYAKAINSYSLFVYKGINVTFKLKDSLRQERQDNY
jgi:hypothetical protein